MDMLTYLEMDMDIYATLHRYVNLPGATLHWPEYLENM